MKHPLLKKVILFLLMSIMIEIIVFNRDLFLSMGSGSEIRLSYEPERGWKYNDHGRLVLESGKTSYIELSGMEGALKYIDFHIKCINDAGKSEPLRVQIAVADEGNTEMYYLPAVTTYFLAESLRYVRAHSYGDVSAMRVYFSADESVELAINGIVYNARVPGMFSWGRVALIFVIGLLAWSIRPGSGLYEKKWTSYQKTALIALVLGINIILLHRFIALNPDFMNPGWTYHEQYHKLAVALTKGEVNIPVGIEEELAALDNPYDTALRSYSVWDAFKGWDTAFYEGKFYVYFGVVPVLLFYLPFYLITGQAFVTWHGLFMIASALLGGVFFLLRQIVKRYFPDTPFLLYVILSVIMGNCMSTVMFMMRPDFYSLPILCAMNFSVWGLGLWVSAARDWKRWKLFSGCLCMALVAGCRPQFLVGSFLIFFLLGPTAKEKWKESPRKLYIDVVIAALPYIVVAAGLMYYNYIRFDSPFDFGANYNLTTNDMRHRGFHLNRMEDGIFMYLFQLPNVGVEFPYVFPTHFISNYVGKTIRENMFGGAFFTNTLLLSVFAVRRVKKQLKQKQLFGLVITALASALTVVIADTQMAGILSRYYADFIWLLFIAANIVLLQLWEKSKSVAARKRIILFVVLSGFWGIFMQLGMGIQAGQIESMNEHAFYMIRGFFS